MAGAKWKVASLRDLTQQEKDCVSALRAILLRLLAAASSDPSRSRPLHDIARCATSRLRPPRARALLTAIVKSSSAP